MKKEKCRGVDLVRSAKKKDPKQNVGTDVCSYSENKHCKGTGHRAQRGITLIVLIITVIVLLILLQVMLKLFESDGIIAKARWSHYVTEYEMIDEQKEMYAINAMAEKHINDEKNKSVSYPVEEEKLNIDSAEIAESLRLTIVQLEDLSYDDLANENCVSLHKVKMEDIGNPKVSKNYVVNIASGMLYSLEAEEYKGKLYHTPRYGSKKINGQTIVVSKDMDEEGSYEMIVDADQVVEWQSVEIYYKKYVEESLQCKTFTSDDEVKWTEIENQTDGLNKDKIEEYKIQNNPMSQYLKVKIDLSGTEISKVGYILVNFYKYVETDIEPEIEVSNNIQEADGLYIPNNTEASGTVKQTIKIPKEDGDDDYIVDLKEYGDTKTKVTVTYPDGTSEVIGLDDLKKKPFKGGTTITIESQITPGTAIEKAQVLKKDKNLTTQQVQTAQKSDTDEEKWKTVEQDIYMYSNGGSGYWKECWLNEQKVDESGIIIESQDAKKRIKMNYQVSKDGKNWSKIFSNIQDGNNTKYLKITVCYQVKGDTEYGAITDPKIKVVLSDGSWKMTYQKPDGEILANKRVYFNNGESKTVTTNLLNITNIDAEGKRLIAWNDGEKEYALGSEYTLSSDKTLTGVYAVPYTITYDINGGTGEVPTDSKMYVKGETVNVNFSKTPTKEGYNFLGWSTSPNATSANYSSSGNKQFEMPARNLTLYAVWGLKTYTITYNANGGTRAPASQTKTHGQTLKITSEEPTKAGYNFLGWSTNSNATSVQYLAGANFTTNQNTTLYAVWERAIDASDFGKKVNYVAGCDNTLVWRIFYSDSNYVYLISEKADGSSPVAKCDLRNFYPSYSGSSDIQDPVLRSLNKKWFEALNGSESNTTAAKCTAYLMDQSVWNGYKDATGNASYVIGSPTLEIYYASSIASGNTKWSGDAISANSLGYVGGTQSWGVYVSERNGIYHNGKSSCWIASPSSYGQDYMYGVNKDSTYSHVAGVGMYYAKTSGVVGLRPIVLIPKDKMDQYTITN